ncbi:Long-chain specific acyl-CoA dehydrogenase-like protein [Emericellopsis cladophorae]|uniref:Long-chain specific acyl-CoA dehydrogenase-like protein n=1 Tax=Emericellopsis cladophorae TaxID=2686198 RepID=A0A9Q0BHG6_9HYPO|nr:Long-chain specific acyl-CoA dehydrogenase-like protein [Emericellopsis cladophorae]KAI6785512.1 Long-chain specific acyl-CoA dehydrogenase-like protein [Emericellopsis cladophorae]
MSAPEVITPLSEPPWLSGAPSPYYDDSHRRLQAACRQFIGDNLSRHALEWETAEEVPPHVFGVFAENNYLIPALPAPLPVEWLKRIGITKMPGDVPVEQWTYIHSMIYGDEMSRAGLAGPGAAITTGMAFGVPPLIHYGSRELQETYLPDLLTGKKRTCIAITEPEAGSDVANITTTAETSKCGKYYVVNGVKKWITNGVMADYATMAVRTGPEGSGPRGISLLHVHLKDQKGVSRRRLKVAGQISAGTSFIELDDVYVPKANLIGKEGEGMKYIMTNFNHERLFISVGVTRQARVALAAAFEYTMKREAFGKTLMDQPVVRHRLAKAAAVLEAQQAWVESFAYQLSQMPKAQSDRELGGLTALCKANAGIVLDECARTAVLLFGGNGYTRTGQGELVEKIYRDVPGARIPGGSEDVLLDLAIRQLVKLFQDKVKTAKSESKL